MRAASRPSASNMTASGLPAPGAGANTSSCMKRRVDMERPAASGRKRRLGAGARLRERATGSTPSELVADETLRMRAHGSCTTSVRWRRATRGLRLESRSEEHTSELQSRENLVCRLLLEKKKEE